MGLQKNSGAVYLIDYGLTKKYVMGGKEHIPFCDRKRMIGTLRYSSINSQLGYEQSRRDDLESLGYCLIYMLKGRLPWQGTEGATREEKHFKILAKKQDIPIHELCRGLPIELAQYMYSCSNLRFEETPAYSNLYKLFQTALQKIPYFDELNDFAFDWNAMNCDLTRRTRRDKEDSNKVLCEGTCKSPKLSMARRIEVNNLAANIKATVATRTKKKSRRKTTIEARFKEMHKEEDKGNEKLVTEKASVCHWNRFARTLSGDSTQRVTEANYKYFQVETKEVQWDFRASDITERVHYGKAASQRRRRNTRGEDLEGLREAGEQLLLQEREVFVQEAEGSGED
eukprot:TRINITY_DN940_c0_g3_i1.p1 TRINITY_DN940_c0_g3~~TRINITY_DN940_c0_g3_i1.p1  ORF type:complete len:341 (+),score=77.43 TRINITY_DN940_c0_g3_i1:568-1590(+)